MTLGLIFQRKGRLPLKKCMSCFAELQDTEPVCPKCGWVDPLQMRGYSADGREYGPHLSGEEQGRKLGGALQHAETAKEAEDCAALRRDESRGRRFLRKARSGLRFGLLFLIGLLIGFLLTALRR